MNLRLPQVTFVFDRYKKATPKKKAAVEIRVTHNRKQKYISTGVRLYSTQWKNGCIVNTEDTILISQMLDSKLKEVRQAIVEMLDENSIDIFSIPSRIEKGKTKSCTFLDFCRQRASIRMYGKRKDTQERYERFIRMFEKWGKIIYFEDITEENIISYDRALSSTGMKPYSKWNNYHRFLNSFIIDAINEGWIRRNPYRWVNINKDKESKGIEKCLTPEEFSRLRDAAMPTESLERVRDLFVFQTYTCLSYSDLKNFDRRSIRKIKGVPVYTGKRHKTMAEFTIPLLPPALALLHKYKGKLPIISNVKYNEYLKVVAQSSGIDKPVSSHWARHTGATMLLNEGVDMRIVSKICGHTSTRITEQVYAKLLDETVVDAIKGLQGKLQ